MKVSLVSITKPTIVDPRDGQPLSAEDLITYCARVSSPQNQLNLETAPRLLAYCIRHRHWSIFEMVSMGVEIETSRAIAQQILRHRSFSFQEFSQRFARVDAIGDDLFEPVELRLKNAGGNRQGSTEPDSPIRLNWCPGVTEANAIVSDTLEMLGGLYRELLTQGVAPECARMVLPLCTRTRIYMTGSVRSWIHYFMVRCDSHAQKEHRLIAEAIRDIFTEQFPNIAAAILDRSDIERVAKESYAAWAAHDPSSEGWDFLAPAEKLRWLAVAATGGKQD